MDGLSTASRRWPSSTSCSTSSSSRRKAGVRKPEPAAYELVLDADRRRRRADVVFLDDLGINLKPARAMGMTTIKVVDPTRRSPSSKRVVGFPLRG